MKVRRIYFGKFGIVPVEVDAEKESLTDWSLAIRHSDAVIRVGEDGIDLIKHRREGFGIIPWLTPEQALGRMEGGINKDEAPEIWAPEVRLFDFSDGKLLWTGELAYIPRTNDGFSLNGMSYVVINVHYKLVNGQRPQVDVAIRKPIQLPF